MTLCFNVTFPGCADRCFIAMKEPRNGSWIFAGPCHRIFTLGRPALAAGRRDRDEFGLSWVLPFPFNRFLSLEEGAVFYVQTRNVHGSTDNKQTEKLAHSPEPSMSRLVAFYRGQRRFQGRGNFLRQHVLLVPKNQRGTLSLGALTLLGGCDVSENAQLQTVLRAVSDWNDRAQSFIFRPNHLAPTYSEADVVKPPRFNAHYDIDEVMPVDGATWQLELSGLIKDKRPWTVEQLYQLPEQEMIIKHICVEGWDYIGQWSGVNLRAFFERIGADTTAKYVAFRCADDYTESLDMASALHPQTMLATKYAREPIGDPYGFPLRLRTATKLGFKNAKWVTAMEVINEFPDTYYRKEGFNWFAGI